MDEKQKKIVLGSVAGVALLAAGVMLVSNFMPSAPKVELTPEQQQAAAQTTQELDKAQEEAAAAAAQVEQEFQEDPAAPKPEHAGGVRLRLPKQGG
jgi:hypothetical protein